MHSASGSQAFLVTCPLIPHRHPKGIPGRSFVSAIHLAPVWWWIASICIDKHTSAFFKTRTRQCAVTLKDTICTWLFVPSHCQDHCLPRAMLEVLLSQHVRIFPSPLSWLSNVLAYLLPSSFRYITDVPTCQKHPTAAPCLPENLVELFSQYPRFTFKTPVFTQAPYLYTAAYSLP